VVSTPTGNETEKSQPDQSQNEQRQPDQEEAEKGQIQLSVYWPFSGGPSLAAKYSTLSDLPKHDRNKQPNSGASGNYRDCIVVRESAPTKHWQKMLFLSSLKCFRRF
jgi:hypothetical protein